MVHVLRLVLLLVVAVGGYLLWDLDQRVDAPEVPPREATGPSVVDTLRNLVSAQAMCRAGSVIDVDENAEGEYGGLLELSATVPGRSSRPTRIPDLPDFEYDQAAGVAYLGGYVYRMFLPSAEGTPVAEPGGGFDGTRVDVERCASFWACYAWPRGDSRDGPAYFVNQQGNVLVAEKHAYSGTDAQPKGDAAFTLEGLITGDATVGSPAGDGRTWRAVGGTAER